MIEHVDSIVSTLSLFITNPDDVLKYQMAYDELRKGWLSSIRTLGTLPTIHEPVYTDRFLLNFPEEFGIPTWTISKVILPSYHNNQEQQVWSHLNVSFMDVVGGALAHNLLNVIKERTDYNVIFQMLDPMGMVAHQLTISIEFMLSFEFSEYNYEVTPNRSIGGYNVIFNVRNLIVNY